MTEDSHSDRLLTRRTVLGTGIGALAAFAAPTSASTTAFDAHKRRHGLPDAPASRVTARRVWAVRDLGCDPTGGEPIDAKVRNAATPGTTVRFEPGTYRIRRQINLGSRSNVALTGQGPSATRFKVDSGVTGIVINAAGGSDVRLTGFTIDQTANNCSANVRLRLKDRPIVENVTFDGFSDPSDSKKKVVVLVENPGGAGRIENVRALDGTEVGRPGVNHNRVHKQRYDGGMWIGPPHRGTLYVDNCQFANYSDNALYASRTNGGVVVRGGYYANSSISLVRLGHPHSFVGGGVKLEVDPSKIPQRCNPSGLVQPRCIWFESGSLGNRGATIGDVDIRYASGSPRAQGLITIRNDASHARIDGPVSVAKGATSTPTLNNMASNVRISNGAINR